VHKVFQGVYESVQFAKLKLLARALERAQVYEGGGLVVSYLLRGRLREVGAVEPYSEGIIDFLRAVEGADMAALIREPPRGGSPARRISLAPRTTSSTSPRSRARRRRRPPPGAGFSSDDSIEEITSFLRASSLRLGRRLMPPKALEPSGIILVDKPRAVVVRDRRRVRRGPATKMGHAGTLDPFATGLLLLLSGRRQNWRDRSSARQALSHGRRPDGPTSTGDPEGDVSSARAPGAAELERGSRASAVRSSCRSRPHPRSRSAASAPTSCTAAASPSRCRCGARA
jgi:hypothetical protein